MASLTTAWSITRNYEGEWTDYDHKLTDKYDEGNYYPFGVNKKPNYVGTNFGFTATFADDYIHGWQKQAPSALYKKMSALSETEVQNVFGRVKWDWCKGDSIQNQSMANLLFDFTIMADQEMVRVVAKSLNRPLAEVADVKKISTRQTTDGYRVLNEKAVELINNHPNPRQLFNIIKSGYLAYHLRKNSVQAIKNRVNSFQYADSDRMSLASVAQTQATNWREKFKLYRQNVIKEKKIQKQWYWGLGIGAAITFVGFIIWYFTRK